MSELVRITNQMSWGDPILPIVVDREWEAEVIADIGTLPDLYRRLAPSKWLRKTMLKWPRIPVSEFPQHLGDIGALVTAQENACRYCYGVARSYLRMFGHSDKAIGRMERDMQFGELDEKERVFIKFCRNLSRSTPRPPKEEREKLISLGFSPKAVSEMAFHIGNHCFCNRVSTFISCMPMHKLETISYSLKGRIMRPIIARKLRGLETTNFDPLPQNLNYFPGVVAALEDTTGAAALNEAMQSAMESEILSQELKILIFAVVARSLECKFCSVESLKMARSLGLGDGEFEQAISSLKSPRLNADETRLLSWARETVHYETTSIQKSLRELSQEVDTTMLLEAIGIASLANTVVRLAILLE